MEGKIHFLNTGHSDCIILESCGKIAMIDSAEDTDLSTLCCLTWSTAAYTT